MLIAEQYIIIYIILFSKELQNYIQKTIFSFKKLPFKESSSFKQNFRTIQFHKTKNSAIDEIIIIITKI